MLKESKPINGVGYVFKKFSNIEFKELNHIVSYLNSVENIITILGIGGIETNRFIISRSNDLNINMKSIFKSVSKKLDIKGGGSPQTVQGGCSKDELDLILQSFFDEITNSL